MTAVPRPAPSTARPVAASRPPLLLRPLPRTLHPGAWWLWAIGLAVAASRTTNPLLLALILAVAIYVVVRRRGSAPWALSFRLYLLLGAFIVVMRVLFRIVFGAGGDTVLFTLPEIPLPEAAQGIRLLGAVAAEDVLGGFYDGLRLATMVVCVGAANALADPKRLLKALPGALHEIGTSVVVALTVAPQLIDSILRVRRARRLRGARQGRRRRRRALHGIIVPVLEDALNRSLHLAAAMSSRGYGRTGGATPRTRLLTGLLMLAGLLGVCAGLYGVLDPAASPALGTPLLLAGGAVAVVGLLAGGRRVRRTSYRPDRWGAAETLTAAAGAGTAALMVLAATVDPAVLHPPVAPLAWPEVSVLPVVAVLAGVLPGLLTPEPPRPGVPSTAAGTPTAASATGTSATAASATGRTSAGPSIAERAGLGRARARRTVTAEESASAEETTT